MSKPTRRLLAYAVALPLLLSAAACKKQVATGSVSPVATPVATLPESVLPPEMQTPPEAPPVPEPKIESPAVATEPASPVVAVQNLEYNYLQFKGKVQYENGNDKQEVQVSIRMKRDSIIWASVSKIGFEGVRAVITPDTVIVLDRLHKTYYAGNFKMLKRRYRVPVTFQQLQATLAGNYLPGEGVRDSSDAPDAAVQRLQHNQEQLVVDQFINREKQRLVKLSVADQRSGNTLTANYDDFKPMRENATGREFPYALLLSVVQAVTPNAAADVLPKTLLISLNHKAVTVPEGKLEFPLAIPADYERK
jgi:hypothetical protein